MDIPWDPQSLWLPAPILVSLIAGAITTLGLVMVVRAQAWSERSSGVFAAFAAGALVTVSLLHLAPAALAATSQAPVLMLAGFAGGFLLNRGVLALSEKRGAAALAAGITPAIGIGFHSFVDGVAYAVTFSVSFETGVLTAVGLVLHELPEGVIVFLLLRGAGFGVRAAFITAFFAAALTTPLGAAVAYPVVSQLDGEALGRLFAVAAGVLLYVGAGHLLPHVERARGRFVLPAAAAGVLVAFSIEALHVHDHGAEHGAGHAHHGPAHHGPRFPHALDDHNHGHDGHDHDHEGHEHDHGSPDHADEDHHDPHDHEG